MKENSKSVVATGIVATLFLVDWPIMHADEHNSIVTAPKATEVTWETSDKSRYSVQEMLKQPKLNLMSKDR